MEFRETGKILRWMSIRERSKQRLRRLRRITMERRKTKDQSSARYVPEGFKWATHLLHVDISSWLEVPQITKHFFQHFDETRCETNGECDIKMKKCEPENHLKVVGCLAIFTRSNKSLVSREHVFLCHKGGSHILFHSLFMTDSSSVRF